MPSHPCSPPEPSEGQMSLDVEVGLGSFWQLLMDDLQGNLQHLTMSSKPLTRSRLRHDRRTLIRLLRRISKQEDQCGIYEGSLLLVVLLEIYVYVLIIWRTGRVPPLCRFLSVR